MNYSIHADQSELFVQFDGDIISANVDDSRNELLSILEKDDVKEADWDTLVLDLKTANIIDSSGLNLLVTLNRHLQDEERRVKVFVASPHIYRTFVYVRLDKKMEVVLDETTV